MVARVFTPMTESDRLREEEYQRQISDSGNWREMNCTRRSRGESEWVSGMVGRRSAAARRRY